MSETLWKRDREQLPSIKILLGEVNSKMTRCARNGRHQANRMGDEESDVAA